MLDLIGAIIIIAVFFAGVVKIIKAAKMPGGSKKQRSRFEDLEADLENLETESEELRARVEVLEKIVTDDKYQLNKDLRNLAG